MVRSLLSRAQTAAGCARRPGRLTATSLSIAGSRFLSSTAIRACGDCNCSASTFSLQTEQPGVSADDDAGNSAAPLTVRQRCDPYEQNGLPLTDTRVQQLITTLQPGWFASNHTHPSRAVVVSAAPYSQLPLSGVPHVLSLLSTQAIRCE